MRLEKLASQISDAANSTPGGDFLPLEIRKQTRDMQPKFDKWLERVHQLKGVEDAKFDLEEQVRMLHGVYGASFRPGSMQNFLDALAGLLEKTWKDEMVTEALLEVWTPPHIMEFFVVEEWDKHVGPTIIKHNTSSGIGTGNTGWN